MKFSIPIRTGSGLNERMHYMQRARMVRAERTATAWIASQHASPAGPVTVTICRVSPSSKGLDGDNLQGGLKSVRDQLAVWLGRDDADDSIAWVYRQRPGKKGEWLVEVEISEGISK